MTSTRSRSSAGRRSWESSRWRGSCAERRSRRPRTQSRSPRAARRCRRRRTSRPLRSGCWQARSGEAGGERERLALEVKGLMRYPVVTVGPGATVDHVADLMLKHDISSLVVAEKDQPAGIVTKLDLVELVAGLKEREELLVQISGLEERPEVYDSLYGVIRKAMMKIAHIVTPRTLTIHVQTYKAEGDRFKSSLRARFATSHKMYYLTHFDWDLHKAMQGLMDILEKQILKEKERRVTERKRHQGAEPPQAGPVIGGPESGRGGKGGR